MKKIKPDKRADTKADMAMVIDRGETISSMEPLLLSSNSSHREKLNDLLVDLVGHSSRFRSSMPAGVMAALANLVRSMNCYYSNLIEGHDTHPIDIERALKGDYSSDEKKRNLQLEAKAHILVQEWIDRGDLKENPVSTAAILEIHKKFGSLLPDDLLWVSDPVSNERIRVVPGEIRVRDVKVGSHIAISPAAVRRFLVRYEEVYSRLGRSEAILAAAAAHHRLLWIHPFLDGNGRVARLISHAQVLKTLDTGGVWSVARGLARSADKYKQHLMACDTQRRSDTDGRGNLSEESLAEFTHFFLETCLDQVKFMEGLIEPSRLRDRILLWAQEEVAAGTLPARAGKILQAVLYRGELPRSEIPDIIGVSSRQARRVVSALLKEGVLVAETDRSPLRLAFPARLASRWMPGLFPESPTD